VRPIDRLLARCTEGEGGCWNYTGSRDARGYARMSVEGRSWLAYRYAYTALIGEIPDGLELDHLCRNPTCCNPWHLDPVTHQINVQRGSAGWSPNSRCKHGHDLSDPSNVYRHTKGKGGRKCRTCALARARRQHQLKKENAA